MPNRILREGILTSDRVNALSLPGEVFYRRLMSVVDDYGRFDARPVMLKVACFPLRVDAVREADISRWIAECEKAGLIALYAAHGKRYLEMRDFRQTVRAKLSKFPDPPDDTHLRSTCVADESACVAHAPVVVVEVGDVVDSTTSSGKPDVVSLTEHKNNNLRQQAAEILAFLNDKAGRNYRFLPVNLDLIVARLKEGATQGEIRAVIVRKVREWKGDERWSKFLRPETLFNRTKFAQYVGEVPPPEAAHHGA